MQAAEAVAPQAGPPSRLKQFPVDTQHFDGMWADGAQGPQDWTLTVDAAPIAGRLHEKCDQLTRDLRSSQGGSA